MKDRTVTKKAVRPVGPPDECLYCQQKVGAEHKPDCVMLTRAVVVRMTVEYVASVPESWSSRDIEFHRNESSWCANNAVRELEALTERPGCLCYTAGFIYVREATQDDGPPAQAQGEDEA